MFLRLLIVAACCFVGVSDLTFAQENKSHTEQKERRSRQYPAKIAGAKVEVYKTIGNVKLKMYIFRPKRFSVKDRRPAIVFFFGGGWRGGTPAQFTKQAEYFASRGMVAMVADYRVSSRHGTKAMQCVADAKSAIRWIRENANKLGIDPQRIVASGGSAGGHIAACTGVVPGMDEEGENLHVSSQPNVMVLFNPALVLAPIDGKNILGDRAQSMKTRVGCEPVKISPYHHVKQGQPPTIIFFGTDDNLLKGAEHFATASKQTGNRCELLTWKGLKHGFFNFGRYKNKPYLETVRAADKFLASLDYLEGEPTIELPD